MFRLISVMLLPIALIACAYPSQSVLINPKVNIKDSSIGGGQALPVNVIDERARQTLGTVAPGSVGADITINGNLVESIQRALTDGLSRLSFKPSLVSSTGRNELRVEIRNLDYTAIKGFWVGTIRVDAGLKAICIRDGIRPYEKLHHGSHEEIVAVVQAVEANTVYVNNAISAAVNALLSDQILLGCLAKGTSN